MNAGISSKSTKDLAQVEEPSFPRQPFYSRPGAVLVIWSWNDDCLAFMNGTSGESGCLKVLGKSRIVFNAHICISKRKAASISIKILPPLIPKLVKGNKQQNK